MKDQTLANLGRALNLIRMYGSEHAATLVGIQQFYESLKSEFDEKTEVFVGASAGRLVHDGQVLASVPIALARLVKTLEERNIGSITFRRAVNRDEVYELLRYLATRSPDFELRNLKHINIRNQVSFGELALETQAAKEISTQALRKADELGEVVRQLLRLTNLLISTEGLTSEQVKTRVGEVVSQVGSESNWGVSQAKQTVQKLVSNFDLQTRSQLFGEELSDRTITGDMLRSLPPHSKAEFIAESITRGEITPAMVTMVTPGKSAVELAEQLVSELLSRVNDPESQAELLAKGFAVLSDGVASAPPRKGVLNKTVGARVSSPEGRRLMRCLSKSYTANYRICRTTGELLRMVSEEDLSLIIIDDSSVEDLERFFEEFRYRARDLPVVLITKRTLMELPPAALGHPKLELVGPDSGFEELVGAIGLDPEDVPAEPEPGTPEEVQKLQLDRAREVVQALLPQELPELRGLDIATHYAPALQVGGDYYDIFELGGDVYGLVIADVSGKAVPAALTMATLRAVLNMVAPKTRSPKETIFKANQMIKKSLAKGMFITLLYCIIDLSTRTIRLCNAGHNPALFWREGLPRPEYLNIPGLVIGPLAGKAYAKVLKQAHINLRKGDLLILYTDGLVEAVNEEQEQFGEERLTELIAHSPRLSAGEVVKLIIDELERFRGKAEPFDDICIIVLMAR